MAAAIATLPRAGGNGAALVMVVADMVLELFAKAPAKAEPEVQVVMQAAALPVADSVDIWSLYRLGVGSDSVNPKVVAELQSQIAD
jgi:hypothetical protein